MGRQRYRDYTANNSQAQSAPLCTGKRATVECTWVQPGNHIKVSVTWLEQLHKYMLTWLQCEGHLPKVEANKSCSKPDRLGLSQTHESETQEYLLTFRICWKHSLTVCSSCLLQSGRSSINAIHNSAMNTSKSWPSSYLPFTTFGSHCWPGRTCNLKQVCSSLFPEPVHRACQGHIGVEGLVSNGMQPTDKLQLPADGKLKAVKPGTCSQQLLAI